MELRISGIVNDSIVDGPGLRLSIFAQGCPHGCPGCHNPHTHDMLGGYLVDTDDILQRIGSNPLLQGITLSGGEPFMQLEPMALLCQEAKKRGLDVMIYTGFLFEELMASDSMRALVMAADYLVDGPFVLEEKTLDKPFAGSANQRVIDVKQTLAANKIVLCEF